MNCKKCGAPLNENDKFCQHCGASVNEEIVNNETVNNQEVNNNINEIPNINNTQPMNNGFVKDENVLLGIIGAFIGSLAGVVAIILLDRLGFVASIAGFAMGICTLFMYEKLAGSISKKGIVISIIVMVIMTLVANNIAFSIQLCSELKDLGYDPSFGKVFINLYDLMAEGLLNNGTYFGNLVLLYLFTALGAFGTLKNKLQMIKNR